MKNMWASDCDTMSALMSFLVEVYSKFNGASRTLRRVGEYASIDDAIAIARQTVDESLLRNFAPEMTAETLYAQYNLFGEVPCIFRTGDYTLSGLGFNAQQYARERSTEICSGK